MDKNLLNQLLDDARVAHATNVYISSGSAPYFKINGSMLKPEDADPITSKELLDLFTQLSDKKAQDSFMRNNKANFLYLNELDKTRYRVEVFRDFKGISFIFKTLKFAIPNMEQMGYPDFFYKISELNHGLVLFSSENGDDVTESICSILEFINKNQEKYIITLEDPIEYVFSSKKSLVNQKELGKHIANISDEIDFSLKNKPDIIFIDKLRNKETIKAALEAASSGCLVFSTVFAASTSKAIDKLLNYFNNDEKVEIRNLLADCLQIAVYQKLFKKSDSEDKNPAFELLINISSIKNAIREGKTYQLNSLIQTSRNYGMITLKDYLQKMIQNNEVDRELATDFLANSNKEEIFKVNEEYKKYDPIFNNKGPFDE